MSERTLKAGTHMFFRAPAKPMPETMADAISQVVAQVAGIMEAHLPECFIEGDKEARQVLVIVVRRRREIPRIAEELSDKLQLLLVPGHFMDILPFVSGSVACGVRQARCQIFPPEKEALSEPS